MTKTNQFVPRRAGFTCSWLGGLLLAFALGAIPILGADSPAAPTNPALPYVGGSSTGLQTIETATPGFSGTNPVVAPPLTTAPTTNAPVGEATNRLAALDEKHKLTIGDRLSFRIVEDEEEPKSLVVADSGELEVPYIGRFVAVDKSCAQLAAALKEELEKEYYFHATVVIAVDLMAKTRGRVYLVGPLRAPGPQDILSDEVLTLSKAILRAGGFTDYADKRNVKVRRKANDAHKEDQEFSIDVSKILEKGKSEADMPLESGDIIFVPERLVRF